MSRLTLLAFADRLTLPFPFEAAERRVPGAGAGPLFLDEIGDMPLALQAKVLRVIQEQAFDRIGGNETVRTDVRLIAATHRNLKAWSAEGRFRPDLYYRLNVFTIHLPALRDRGEDLLMLVQLYLRRFSRELAREVHEVAPDALERLRGYSWPGNIRELQSILKQALLQASGRVLLSSFQPSDLPQDSLAGKSNERLPEFPPDMTLAELERRAIQQCLLQSGGNRQQTAEILGISAHPAAKDPRVRIGRPIAAERLSLREYLSFGFACH